MTDFPQISYGSLHMLAHVLGKRCLKNIPYDFVSVELFLLTKNIINNNIGCGRYFINLIF